jgi:hypothetical protein
MMMKNATRRKRESLWLTAATGVAFIEIGVYTHHTWISACGIALAAWAAVAFLLSLRSAGKS